MPTRCNRGFYCRSYCLLNMFRAPLCPSSGARVLYSGCCMWYFVVDRRYRRLRCPLVCTEVQTINRSERIAKQTVATVCLAMRSLRLIICTSVHTSGHLNLQYLRSTTKNHRQQPLYNTLELLMMGIVVPETC